MEIKESVPFSSWHGTPIGDIQVFPEIKITVIRLVRMSTAPTVVQA